MIVPIRLILGAPYNVVLSIRFGLVPSNHDARSGCNDSILDDDVG